MRKITAKKYLIKNRLKKAKQLNRLMTHPESRVRFFRYSSIGAKNQYLDKSMSRKIGSCLSKAAA